LPRLWWKPPKRKASSRFNASPGLHFPSAAEEPALVELWVSRLQTITVKNGLPLMVLKFSSSLKGLSIQRCCFISLTTTSNDREKIERTTVPQRRLGPVIPARTNGILIKLTSEGS
jgi:hypothetical protein